MHRTSGPLLLRIDISWLFPEPRFEALRNARLGTAD
jgi:hypothetical protein